MYVPGVQLDVPWWNLNNSIRLDPAPLPAPDQTSPITTIDNKAVPTATGQTLLERYRDATPGEKYAMTDMLRGGIIGEQPTWGETFVQENPFHGVPLLPVKVGLNFLGYMIDRQTAVHQNARRLSQVSESNE